MAISAVSILEATPHSVNYLVTEDGNAVDTVQQDVPSDMVTGPLSDLLNPTAAIANQAAAQALIDLNCDITVTKRAGTQAGATGGAQLACNPNVNGAAAGNFSLDFSGLKAANGDTATYVVRLALRHSVVD